jgi:predicted  nucleic acid-binding Zn-ribbon protein
VEGEVRIARENLDELEKQLKDGEVSLKRKESDLYALSVRCEETLSQSNKSQRQAQALEARCKEVFF